MIAICGFGDEFPINIYVWERDAADLNTEDYKNLIENLNRQQ